MRRRNLANIYDPVSGAVESLARSDDACAHRLCVHRVGLHQGHVHAGTLHNAPIAIVDEG